MNYKRNIFKNWISCTLKIARRIFKKSTNSKLLSNLSMSNATFVPGADFKFGSASKRTKSLKFMALNSKELLT